MTVIKGILIPAEESDAATVVELEQGDLKAMQDCVGGYVQMVDGTNPDLTFVINEDGKIKCLETRFYDPITFDRVGDN